MVELRQEAFDAAESVAPLLRPDPSAREDWYVGFVEELRGGIAPDEQSPSGEVWLSVYEDESFVRARVYLSADQYALANTAHMSGDLVRLKGVLRRTNRVRQLDTIREFGILHPDDA